jgi:hypothetical protein
MGTFMAVEGFRHRITFSSCIESSDLEPITIHRLLFQLSVTFSLYGGITYTTANVMGLLKICFHLH